MMPRGYEVTEPPQGAVPRRRKEWVPATVRQARAAEREDRREACQRAHVQSLPGYIARGTGSPPRPDRVVEPSETDHPGAYAYRNREGALYFLYRHPEKLAREVVDIAIA